MPSPIQRPPLAAVPALPPAPPTARTSDAPASPNSPAAVNAAAARARANRTRRDRTSRRSGSGRADGLTSPANAPVTDPFDPSTFTTGPEHDVVHELTYNRDAYTSRDQKWISLLGIPKQVIACVKRLRGQITEPSRPGVAVTMSCCLARGLRLLSEDPHVLTLDAFRDETDALRATCGKPGSTISRAELDDLVGVLDAFPFKLPSTSSSGTRRQNFAVPPELLSSVEELKTTLGMTTTDLCVFAIALALAEQPSLSQLDRDEFNLASAEFAGRLHRRLVNVQRWLADVVKGTRLSRPDMRIVQGSNEPISGGHVGPVDLSPESIEFRDGAHEEPMESGNESYDD